MICKKCGSQIDDDSVFCQKCGEKQIKTTDINSNKDVLNKKHPKKAKIIIITIILFLVAIIASVSLIVYNENNYGENNKPPIGLPEAAATDFEYEYDEDLDGVVITKYLRIATKVRIPKEIEGKPVVGIDGAFYGTNVEEVYIPNSVTAIRNSAFDYCKNLINITIPNGVTSIDGFEYCTSLTSIILPEGIETLGPLAFSHCTNLKSVTLPDSLTRIDNHAFFNCSSLTSLKIPNGVNRIDLSAFDGTGITSIEVPDKVQDVHTSTSPQFQNLTVIYKGKSYTNEIIIDHGNLYMSYDEFYNRGASENSTDSDTTAINIDDYVGKWYISGQNYDSDYHAYERNLSITNAGDNQFFFQLMYFRVSDISSIATLHGNAADFTFKDDFIEVKGTLIFNENSIIVNITNSNLRAMPVETMTFDSRDVYDDGYCPRCGREITYGSSCDCTWCDICNAWMLGHGHENGEE